MLGLDENGPRLSDDASFGVIVGGDDSHHKLTLTFQQSNRPSMIRRIMVLCQVVLFGRDASLPVAKTFSALPFTDILHVNMPSSCANHRNVVNQSALIIRCVTIFRFFK